MIAEEALAIAKSYTKKSLEGQGALKGDKGDKGEKGEPGYTPQKNVDYFDGVSPTATVEKVGKVATITITDKNGTTTATIKDGEGSEGGEANVIDSISVNGVNVVPDENKNVDITVPSIEGLTKDEDLATVAKSGSYEDLSNKPTIPSLDGYAKTSEIPTKVSQLENDSNYLSSIPEEYVTETELNAKGYLTEHQDISGKVDKVEGKSLISDTEIARLATVDNYDDTDIKAEIAKKADITSIPRKVSVLENDSKYQTESDVTTTLSDYATKTYVGEQIANAEHLKREIVTVLPSDTEASDNIIYMLKVESATGNDKYQEYMKIDGTVQMVGDTSVDLTDYAKTVDIPTTVAELSDSADYAKTADIPTTLPANGGNADTVNNHTVNSDVPENAVFTDTIYDDTEVKGSIEELSTYSTEETKVGTWVDGKPIYRRVYKVTNITTNIDLYGLNIADIITINGSLKQTNGDITPFPYAPNNQNNYDTYIKTGYYKTTTKEWIWQFGSTATTNFSSGIFIIEYTKATD